MLVVSASKTCKVLPALVACLLAVAVVACLVHTDGIDEVQTAHQGHRHTSSSSAPHLTLDLHCRLAVLPGAVMLLWGRLVVLVRRELEIDPTSLTFFAFSGDTLCSDLFITSASALPMVDKFNDCRIEFRVVGFGGRKPPAPEVSVGMVRP